MIIPMLGARHSKDLSTLHYPMFLSPKLNGVRCFTEDGVVYSEWRTPIPNRNVQRMYGYRYGFDGVLIYGNPTDPNVYNKTLSIVEDEEGPEVDFYVFDNWAYEGNYKTRYEYVKASTLYWAKLVNQRIVNSEDDVIAYEKRMVELGYEEVILRNPDAMYKHGRITFKDDSLLKVRHFFDSEAIVLDVRPLVRKNNEAETGTEDNSRTDALLGRMIVKDLYTDIQFSISSGFDEQTRIDLWKQKDSIIDKIVKYKYFHDFHENDDTRGKDKPRFPVFVGFRVVDFMVEEYPVVIYERVPDFKK